MSDRIHVRVTMNGKAAIRELIVGHRKLADLTYHELATAIRDAAERLRRGKSRIVLPIGEHAIEMTFAEALAFISQASSALRW